MKNTRVVKAILKKIVEYGAKIEKYTGETTYDDYSKNEMLRDSVSFCIIQIGELVNRLDADFLDRHSDIPYYQIRGMRNRIVHEYHKIDHKITWDAIQEYIPELVKNVEHILKQI